MTNELLSDFNNMWQQDIIKTMKLNKIFLLLFVTSCFYIQLQANDLIVKEIERKDKNGPWPEFEVITTIEATPLESVAIYYALDYQKDYVPGVIKSEVIDQPTPLEAITSYEFRTPWPLPNSSYINGSKLQKVSDQTYQVNWWFISNSSADDVFGSATFSPSPLGTKLVYRSYIAPKSALAGFFKNTASGDIAKTIYAIKNHIELLKQKESPILNKYKTKILDALENKYTYK